METKRKEWTPLEGTVIVLIIWLAALLSALYFGGL